MEDLAKTGELQKPETDEAENAASLPVNPAPSTCVVDRTVFDIPENYVHTQAGQQRVRYSDDELLQMAILKSQLDSQREGVNVVRFLVLKILPSCLCKSANLSLFLIVSLHKNLINVHETIFKSCSPLCGSMEGRLGIHVHCWV